MNDDDYSAACQRATTAQGLDPLSALEANYDYAVNQTGGFCMVGRVDRPDDSDEWVGIIANEEGFLLIAYADDIGEDGTVLAEHATLEQIPAILDTWLLPSCMYCSERKWAVDADVTTRAKVVLNLRAVTVDRCQPEAELGTVGSIICDVCGADANDDQKEILLNRAAAIVRSGETSWSVITDYRQF